MRRNKLPNELSERYIKFFILPLTVIFLYFFFLNPEKSINILAFGFIFVLIDLFFINKANWGKKAWFYSDIIFLFFCLILFIVHFKTFNGL